MLCHYRFSMSSPFLAAFFSPITNYHLKCFSVVYSANKTRHVVGAPRRIGFLYLVGWSPGVLNPVRKSRSPRRFPLLIYKIICNQEWSLHAVPSGLGAGLWSAHFQTDAVYVDALAEHEEGSSGRKMDLMDFSFYEEPSCPLGSSSILILFCFGFWFPIFSSFWMPVSNFCLEFH